MIHSRLSSVHLPAPGIIMITRSIVFIVACFGTYILVQTLVPTAAAMKHPNSNVDYMVQDHGSRKRHNYRFQRMKSDDISQNVDNIYLTHVTETFDPDANPEELSAFIVDYNGNILRDDMMLLDNSIETRTRKRGNIKVEKKYDQAIPDSPCSCESNKEIISFGEYAFPKFVENKTCSRVQQACVPPYICKEVLYKLKVLKKRDPENQKSIIIPIEFRDEWIGEEVNVSLGCICTGNYLI